MWTRFWVRFERQRRWQLPQEAFHFFLWSRPHKRDDRGTGDELHFWAETIKGVNSVQKQFCNEYLELLTTCVFLDVKLPPPQKKAVSLVFRLISVLIYLSCSKFLLIWTTWSILLSLWSVITFYHGRCDCHMPSDSERKEFFFSPKNLIGDHYGL